MGCLAITRSEVMREHLRARPTLWAALPSPEVKSCGNVSVPTLLIAPTKYELAMAALRACAKANIAIAKSV